MAYSHDTIVVCPGLFWSTERLHFKRLENFTDIWRLFRKQPPFILGS
jgi:hypothetical protein